MRDATAQVPAEEEFPELSYLLLLPADTSANEKTVFQRAVTSSSRRKNMPNASPVKQTRREARVRTFPSSAGTDGQLTATRKADGKDASCSSVKSRFHGTTRLHQELQQPPQRQPPWQTHQALQNRRQDRSVELQQHEHNLGELRESSQRRRERQWQQQDTQQRLTVSHNSAECNFREQPDCSIRASPTAPPAAVKRHQTPVKDLAALQRRRREAAAAATATSKNRLESYRQRRRLQAAKQEAAQQEKIEKSRLEFLDRLRKHHAEQEQWRQQQQEEGMLLLRLQQEFDQRQAERKMQLKLLQAARAAAALRTLAAERAARAAAAGDSERRRDCVRRMEQVRAAAQRAKAAVALRRVRSSQGNSQSQRAPVSGPAAISTSPGAAPTAAPHTNNQDSIGTGEGEKPRLLSSSTARRMALRQQKYSTSFLHRLMVDGEVDRLPRQSSAPPSELEPSSSCSETSCCVPRLYSSSAFLQHGKGSTRIHPDAQFPLSPPSLSMTTSLSTVPATQYVSLVRWRARSPVGRLFTRPAGEVAYETEVDCNTAERRPALGRQVSSTAHPSAATTDNAVVKCSATAAKTGQEVSSTGSTVPPVKAACSSTCAAVELSSTPALPPPDTDEPVERWQEARGVQSYVHPLRDKSGTCDCSSSSASAASAAGSTAATTPRAAPNAAAKSFDGAIFTTSDLTFPTQMEAETAEQTPTPGDAFGVFPTEQSSFRGLSEADILGGGCPQPCGRTGHFLHTTPRTSEGVAYLFADAGVSVERQEGAPLPASLNPESGTVQELCAGSPQNLPQVAPPLLLLETSTEVPFAAEGAQQPKGSTSASVCLEVTNSGDAGFNVECNNACAVADIDHDRGGNVSSTHDTAKTCCTGNAATWLPKVEQNGDSGFFLEGYLAAATQWDDANSWNNISDEGLTIHPTQRTRHFLADTESSMYTHMSATRARTLKHDSRKSDSLSIRFSSSDSSPVQGEWWEAGSSDDCGNNRYPVEHANEEKSFLFQPPSTSSPSVPDAQTRPSAARKALPLAAAHATLCCSNSPSASPRAYRLYGTPNFGLRVTSTLAGISDSDATLASGSSRKWRVTGILPGNEPTTDTSDSALATKACTQQQEQAQKPERQQEEHRRQKHEQNHKNDSYQEGGDRESTKGMQQRLRSECVALRSTERRKVTNYPVVVCGGGGAATAGAASSQAAHSSLPYSSMDGPSQPCGTAAGPLESIYPKCPEEIPLDFSERVRMQQQGRTQQCREDYNLPLLQLQSFSNHLNSLYSSGSSSSDLNNSNGGCCCETIKAGAALQERRHSSRKNRGCPTACDQPVVATCGDVAEPNVTVTTALAEYALRDDAAAAAAASSPVFDPDPKSETNCLRHSDARRPQGQQRWPRRLRGLIPVSEAVREQTSDGAEADAESSFTSADEAEGCPGTRVERTQEDETECERCLHAQSISKVDKSGGCNIYNDADQRALSTKKHNEGRLLKAAPVRVACMPRKALQKAEDDDPAAVDAGVASAAVAENVSLSVKGDPSTGASEPRIPPVLSCAAKTAENDIAVPQDDAPTTASDGAAKAKTHQRTEETQQQQEGTRVECYSCPSEHFGPEKEGAGSESKENCAVPEPRVLYFNNQLLPAKRSPLEEQHSHEQRGQLPLSTAERELCSKRRLQQFVGSQTPRKTAANSSKEAVCQGLIPHGEAAVTALLDEFLEVESLHKNGNSSSAPRCEAV